MAALPSIHRRLSRLMLGVALAWGVAVSGVVWLAVQHEVDALLDDTLQESAEILLGLLSFNKAQLPLNGGGALPAPTHDEDLVWQIAGPQGDVLLRSHRAPLEALSDRQIRGLSSNDVRFRVFALPFDGSGRMLYVAQRGETRHRARMEAAAFTSGAALVVGLLCALALRWQARRELMPISDLSASIAHFDPLQPESGLAAPQRAELLPMHDAIRDLGKRLASRLASERAFSAHAAHALRTPLAGMVAQLAVAQRLASPSLQPHLQRSREAADRLRRVVTALLTLFRTGAEVNRQPVVMADLVAELSFDPLSLSYAGEPQVFIDPDLLAAALMNLLDNSARHGATEAGIDAQAQPGCDIVLTVRDNGRGIASTHRDRLQAALDAERYEGTMGLGLMLADLVARAHGGRLSIAQSDTGSVLVLHLGRSPMN